MKTLLQRFRHLLGLVLLFTPLAWAVTFNGLNIQIMAQLSFDTRTVQADTPSADQLARSVGSGPYTLAARSPYSRGAITYASSAPAVATVAGMAGVVVDLVIQQDETANYHGQTITVPGAIRIVSDTDVPSCSV